MLLPVSTPRNLTETIHYFADPDRSLDFMVQMRWPDGVACARCGNAEVSFLKTRRIWKCKGCKRQFSVKVGTIFEDSPLGWDKWLPALYLMANCRTGISSYELARSLGVTQKTAWFMLHRIRLAMRSRSFDRNRFSSVKGSRVGTMGPLLRGDAGKAGTVQAPIVSSTKREALVRIALGSGSLGSTDAHPSDDQKGQYSEHGVIDPDVGSVDAPIHTSWLQSFWGLFKRTPKGP